MSAQYQTVIYEKSSGTILLVSPNLYVSSRKYLAKLAGHDHWSGLGFLYFPFPIEIDTQRHTVRPGMYNLPAYIMSEDGIPIDFELTMLKRREKLTAGVNCLVEFEGGMGDQLMEAAAVLDAIKKYPKSTFAIQCRPHFEEILRKVKGIPEVHHIYVGQTRHAFDYVISNHTHYISDPRGSMYGKASLYGAWLGLDSVSHVAKIKLKASDYKAFPGGLTSVDFSDKKINILCQWRSGSGHAKSWNVEAVIALAALCHEAYDCNFFVVGLKNEMTGTFPGIINLCGKPSWWETCLLVSKVNLAVCIDSGVMHLSRSLNTPYVCLWGGTNAGMILGEKEQTTDIRLKLDCYDEVCYSCGRKSNDCMTKITPKEVLKNAQFLLKQQHKKEAPLCPPTKKS